VDLHRMALPAIALAALMGLAGSAVGVPVASVSAAHGTDFTLDGTTDLSLAQDVPLPAGLPLAWRGFATDFAFAVDPDALVVPLPVGEAYASLAPAMPHMMKRLVAVDAAGLSLALGDRAMTIPWFYVMDDAAVRPAPLLSWATGTETYLAFLHQAYGYSLELVDLGAGPDPFTPFALLPHVGVQTSVDEVAVATQLTLEAVRDLASGVPAETAPPTAAFEGTGVATSAIETTTLLAPLDERTALPTSRADAPSGSEAGVTLPTQAASLPSLFAQAPLQTAAAGAASFLVGLVLYHLIRKSALLRNKVRSAIAEFVLLHPGSTITEIAEASGVTHQTASYHLRLLQEHGLVLGVERGNKRLYFRNDGSFNNEERGLVAVLRDPESMRVLRLVRENPWIMKNEAAAALGVSRNTLNWHLQKLVGADLVNEARENGHCFLFCNRKVSDEVLGHVADKVKACNDGQSPLPPGAQPGAAPPMGAGADRQPPPAAFQSPGPPGPQPG